MRVLIIKMSSMGDVIHTLPALTDAARAFPDIQFDWVVEESFSAIPRMHPAVSRVIPIQLRQWRKNLFSKKTWDTWRQFKKNLQTEKYDLVIDAQGLLKSAFISVFARGKRVGFDKHAAREKIASLFYQIKYPANKNQLAIQKVRELFSKALGYDLPNTPLDYGLKNASLTDVKNEAPYIIFLHGTTWKSKEYPLIYWQQLAEKLIQLNYRIKISGKSGAEIARAYAIANQHAAIDVLPNLSINNMTTLLQNATAAVAVDTGFAHLAAALNVPVIGLYGATNAALTGVAGKSATCLAAEFVCSPCMNRVCTYKKPSAVVPACYETLPPEKIVSWLQNL